MLATLVIFWLGLLISLPPRPSAWLVFASGLPILACLSWRDSRRRHVAWAAELRDTADVHLLGLVLLYALGVQLADTHGVTTDGVTYFTQLRSLIFDLGKVRDRSTYTEPNHYSEGILHVLVNGKAVVSNGAITDARPGQVIRGMGYKRQER